MAHLLNRILQSISSAYSKEMGNIVICLKMSGGETVFRQDCTGTS